MLTLSSHEVLNNKRILLHLFQHMPNALFFLKPKGEGDGWTLIFPTCHNLNALHYQDHFKEKDDEACFFLLWKSEGKYDEVVLSSAFCLLPALTLVGALHAPVIMSLDPQTPHIQGLMNTLSSRGWTPLGLHRGCQTKVPIISHRLLYWINRKENKLNPCTDLPLEKYTSFSPLGMDEIIQIRVSKNLVKIKEEVLALNNETAGHFDIYVKLEKGITVWILDPKQTQKGSDKVHVPVTLANWHTHPPSLSFNDFGYFSAPFSSGDIRYLLRAHMYDRHLIHILFTKEGLYFLTMDMKTKQLCQSLPPSTKEIMINDMLTLFGKIESLRKHEDDHINEDNIDRWMTFMTHLGECAGSRWGLPCGPLFEIRFFTNHTLPMDSLDGTVRIQE